MNTSISCEFQCSIWPTCALTILCSIFAVTKWLLGVEMKSKCTERHDVTTTAADGFTEETKSKPTLSGGPYVPWITSQLLVRKCGRCLLKIATL